MLRISWTKNVKNEELQRNNQEMPEIFRTHNKERMIRKFNTHSAYPRQKEAEENRV